MMVNKSTTGMETDDYYHDHAAARLREKNDLEVKALYPLIIFIASILIIGLIGNILVLIVFLSRYKRSPARLYIVFLSAIDCGMCTVGLVYHMYDLMNPYTYTNTAACKSLTFIVTSLFLMSVFLLNVIAFDRYMKVCHPLSSLQMSSVGQRRACFFAVCMGLVCSWPNIILYGKSEMETIYGNETGYSCFFETSYIETSFPSIYTVVLIVICTCCTVFLVVTYSLIVYQIYKHYRTSWRGNMKFIGEETIVTDVISLRSFRGSIKRSSKTPPRWRNTDGDANKYAAIGIKHDLNEYAANDYNTMDDKVCYPPSSDILNDIVDNNESSPRISSESLTSKDEHIIGPERKMNNSFERHSMNDIASGNIPLVDDNILPYINSEIVIKTIEADNDDGMVTEHGPFDRAEPMDLETVELLNRTGTGDEEANISVSNLVSLAVARSLKYRSDTHLANTMELGIQHDERRSSESKLFQGLNLTYSKLYNNGSMITVRNSSRRATQQQQHHKDNLTQQQQHHKDSLTQQQQHHKDSLAIPRFHFPESRRHSRSVTGSYQEDTTARPPAKHSKITKIMLTITIVFVISYCPCLFLTIWSLQFPDFWDNLTMGQTVACEFFLRLYLINNVVNPFIYGFWDVRFQREIKSIARKFFNSNWCRCLRCKQ